MDTIGFAIRKRGFFRKVKEIKGWRGSILKYAAQGIPQIDAEIATKRPFPDGNELQWGPWMDQTAIGPSFSM
jgi:hypothetical protein